MGVDELLVGGVEVAQLFIFRIQEDEAAHEPSPPQSNPAGTPQR